MNLEEQIKALLEKKSEEVKDSKEDAKQDQQPADHQDQQEEQPAVTIENPLDPNLTAADLSPQAEIQDAQEQGVKDEEEENKKENQVAESIGDLMGADLSEEFKANAQKIFETAVAHQVAQIKESLEKEQQLAVTKIEEDFENKFVQRCKLFEEEHCEKIDGYLGHLVESWKQDNEVALEAAIKSELTEAFIGNLKQFFESHYMDLPSEKVDLYQQAIDEKQEIESKLNESVQEMKVLEEQLNGFKREHIIEEFSKEFSSLDKARLKSLTEDFEFDDEESFRKKVSNVKGSFFTTKGNAKEQLTEDLISTPKIVETGTKVNLEENTTMSAYVRALSRK